MAGPLLGRGAVPEAGRVGRQIEEAVPPIEADQGSRPDLPDQFGLQGGARSAYPARSMRIAPNPEWVRVRTISPAGCSATWEAQEDP